MKRSYHNPDILTCLANLSSDEVFTPPNIANKMLDTLPKELWHDKSATFLDPACKTGVFLREITKRLLKGLESEIPDSNRCDIDADAKSRAIMASSFGIMKVSIMVYFSLILLEVWRSKER